MKWKGGKSFAPPSPNLPFPHHTKIPQLSPAKCKPVTDETAMTDWTEYLSKSNSPTPLKLFDCKSEAFCQQDGTAMKTGVGTVGLAFKTAICRQKHSINKKQSKSHLELQFEWLTRIFFKKGIPFKCFLTTDQKHSIIQTEPNKFFPTITQERSSSKLKLTYFIRCSQQKEIATSDVLSPTSHMVKQFNIWVSTPMSNKGLFQIEAVKK
ncbi:hypothetical protein OUZ56_020601 [Daphnia magna]|uniref:Uncharacterized protein n=1 Tax=Daphnia magna TaxID=35525 RepID=A0ABQ9ZFM8_9CRUS|nr:hypothetical protein OUZ56_020601 [Daphnia magna]